jgi:hypothetical protein
VQLGFAKMKSLINGLCGLLFFMAFPILFK